jgi:4-amino-4-deoxy-L-arabinose transferase-like glycosyltransferase
VSPVRIPCRFTDPPLFGRRLRTPSATLALGILVAAVVLRAYWAVHYGTVLLGCEYVRIAENLLTNRTYVGLGEGPELMFPPFFPVLLTLGSFLAGSVEGAARLIPVLAGVLLVPVAFALARLVYGLRVALGVAALTALHPVLIDLSSTTESETVYLPLMLAGFYWGLRALDSGRLTRKHCSIPSSS